MSKIKISLRISKDLIQRADVAAKITEKSRGEIVAEALQDHLAELEDDGEFKEDVFDRYLDGQIRLETLNRFLDSEASESLRVSKTLLDQRQDPDHRNETEE